MSDRAYVLGDPYPLTYEVRDADGELADPTSWGLIIRHESGTSENVTGYVTHPSVGLFQLDYVSTATGRHVAVFTTTGDHAGIETTMFDIVAVDLAFITVTDLRNYLGDVSDADAVLLEALKAERRAQARVCIVDPYTEDLREALLRRVARNLAARKVPVATLTSFEGGTTSSRVPREDPEIVRLESNYWHKSVLVR